MPELLLSDWGVVLVAALCAGLVDSIVGGGGLILVPALFSTFPQVHPATLFGINKGASIWGTAFASWQYGRRVTLRWPSLGPAMVAGFAGSLAGAWLVTQVSPHLLRAALPLVLLAVLLYTLARKDMGQTHAPHLPPGRELGAMMIIGGCIGFYDGFFGPGTGSFFVFLMVRWLRFDFLHASASAKLLNTATNGAALLLFIGTGHIAWTLAAGMAVANVAGSLLGTRLALKHGARFVRQVFLWVVSALILKTGYDAWIRLA
jgi:uncharacterized protein